MMANAQEKTRAFFDLFAAREFDEARKLFADMLRECVLECALEAAGNPSAGLGQWEGGRISICEAMMNGMESALERAKGNANPDAAAGLAYPPI